MLTNDGRSILDQSAQSMLLMKAKEMRLRVYGIAGGAIFGSVFARALLWLRHFPVVWKTHTLIEF